MTGSWMPPIFYSYEKARLLWMIAHCKEELSVQYEREIQVLAYFKWEEAGRPDGRQEEFWLAAEKEFFEEHLPQYPNGNFPFMNTV